MKFTLSKRSRDNLKHVHPDLVLVCALAIQNTEIDFAVTEGIRTLERQKKLIASGASSLKDPKSSRHVPNDEGLCHAIDVVAYLDGKVDWSWPLYHKIAEAFKESSKELNIPIEWGGDWKSFPDGPHFQLPKRVYK
jgi:peptidoglycan L-alanyl-D-glutamate endopeptidase CwlK